MPHISVLKGMIWHYTQTNHDLFSFFNGSSCNNSK